MSERKQLPNPRRSTTWKLIIVPINGPEVKLYMSVGHYEDGSPGELFLTLAKEGSTLREMIDAFAISVSTSLQYGVPLERIVKQHRWSRFEPSGEVRGHPDVPRATSLTDMIAQVLAAEYLNPGRRRMEVVGLDRVALDDPNIGKAFLEAGKAIREMGAHIESEVDTPLDLQRPDPVPVCPKCKNRDNVRTVGSEADGTWSDTFWCDGCHSWVLSSAPPVDPKPISHHPLPVVSFPQKMTTGQAVSSGYTEGAVCDKCGSLRMRRDGTCLSCEECGNSSGGCGG